MDGDLVALVGRILLAMTLGGLIGAEREIGGQNAGLRTHIAVALGAALFGVISVDGFDGMVDRRADTNVNVDVTRVASQVVVGIGFLGAGTIVKHHASVRGLTTAASLWVTAAVGLAVGIRAYGPAVVTTGAVLLSLAVMRWPRRWIARRFAVRTRMVAFHLAPDADLPGLIDAIHGLEGIDVSSVTVRRSDEGRVVEAEMRPEPGRSVPRSVDDLSRRDGVTGLDVL